MKKFLLVFVLLLWGLGVKSGDSKIMIEWKDGRNTTLMACSHLYKGNLFEISRYNEYWRIQTDKMDNESYEDAKQYYDSLRVRISSEVIDYSYKRNKLGILVCPTNIKNIHN